MAAEHPYAADNDAQEDMIINPLGVAASEDLSIEEKLDRLVAMKQAVGQRGADGTLDPGLVSRQMQDIDVAMARVQSQSDPADTRGGDRRPDA
ncbi:hypothetical protein B7H23_03430 [Notoacmeibacter marinus]|uniref:Uncharacterized protein n=1 Tax=Notoacmeibacter marinus TaxID=1876515 RepID=A0A231V1D0_9HYPH|nr:hypothetical protein [Notoacmeibacter marinus]OXT01998.1 hypothetical protein B7H23_03430 [Notoacmeibacter marinus]